MSTIAEQAPPQTGLIAEPSPESIARPERLGWGTRLWHGLAIFAILLGVWFVLWQGVLRPWYLRWGATDAEVAAVLPGDELIAQDQPGGQATLAVTIAAPASAVWPWLVQFGQAKGGWYSYEWFENLLGCQMTNADRVHPEWQDTRVGDPVSMYPAGSGPPPYRVALLQANRAFVMGHPQGDQNAPITAQTRWNDTWALILQPLDAQHTRLVFRGRVDASDTTVSSPVMQMIEPGFFVMERGMLLGIQERVERAAGTYSGAVDGEGLWFALLCVAALGLIALFFARRWPWKPAAIAAAWVLWLLAFFYGHPSPLLAGLVALAIIGLAVLLYRPVALPTARR